MLRRGPLLLLIACLGVAATATAVAEERSRVIVLTDIGNEPDDSESMVRFLLYANEFDVEALIATTSTWQRTVVHPELIEERVRAYGKVLDNLRAHAPGYPDMQELLSKIRSGRPAYGLTAVGAGKDTAASEWIIKVVDRQDPRPVWITIWGGAVDLAQALHTVRRTRSPAAVKAFAAKLRVYSISDQDDAGPWIRRNFPDLFWIASIHAFGAYANATWPGISGESLMGFEGPDPALVSREWAATKIQRGPLGLLYPSWQYLMEGDTPSFLYLIPNGLGDPEHPEYGSWGGRYDKVTVDDGLYADTLDTVTGAGGKRIRSSKATIWRWREAYQNDFTARMQWTLDADRAKANHPPEVVVNGSAERAPLRVIIQAGMELRLDASGTRDPDGQALQFHWSSYAETSRGAAAAVPLNLEAPDAAILRFTVPPLRESGQYQLVLEVRDAGEPALFRYRRVIVDVLPSVSSSR